MTRFARSAASGKAQPYLPLRSLRSLGLRACLLSLAPSGFTLTFSASYVVNKNLNNNIQNWGTFAHIGRHQQWQHISFAELWSVSTPLTLSYRNTLMQPHHIHHTIFTRATDKGVFISPHSPFYFPHDCRRDLCTFLVLFTSNKNTFCRLLPVVLDLYKKPKCCISGC